jgi:putative transposase
MSTYRILLEPGSKYHIYNHAVGSENLFREKKNYRFFLNKLIPRISPFADVLAYCLMPNHFHFIIRIKEKKVLVNLWQAKMKSMKEKRLKINSQETADHFLLDRLMVIEFGNFFNSYAQAYNKAYRRYGSLFKESFQRKIVTSDSHLLKLICYVHNNPIAHGFTSRRGKWEHSSYLDILRQLKCFVPVEEVLQLFGDVEDYIFLHDRFFNMGYGH